MKRVLGTWLVFLSLVGSGFLLLSLGVVDTQGEGPIPQAAPLNRQFIEYLRQAADEVLLAESRLAGPEGRVLGYVPSPVDFSHLDRLPVTTGEAVQVLPTFFDWRTSKGFSGITPVKDQGYAGTCWAFANMGAVEALHKINHLSHPNTDLSENNLASCQWPWLGTKNSGGNTSIASSYLVGLVKPSTLLLRQKGALRELQDPYSDTSHNDQLCSDTGRPFPYLRVGGFRRVASTTAAMKQAIYDRGPLVTAYYHDNSRYNSSTYTYYYPNCPYGSNHEVLLVGWDDNRSHPGGKGCWIVKNSWGTRWGNQGFFYLAYNSGQVGTDNLCYLAFRGANANENFYMEDRPGLVYQYGWGTTSASGAIAFSVPHATETLSHVEFYTTSNNAQYTIRVWDTVTTSGTSVSFSNLLASKSGVCQEMGYYAIPLATPVPLTGGKKYGVEVRFTTPGYSYPLPVAGGVTGWVDGTFIGKGSALSYARSGTSGPFTRFAPGGKTMAVCVRARTTY